MTSLEHTWFTASDGHNLFYRFSVPAHPKAHMIIIHGYGEHSERYLEAMEYFSKKGLACFAPDHRGHGKSAKRMGYIKSFERIVKDIYELKALINKNHGSHKVFLIGHSMGSLIGLRFLSAYQKEIQGAALIAPMILTPDYISPVLKALSGFIAALFPTLPIQEFDTAETTRNQEVIAAAHADPLCYHGKIRARTGVQMLKAMEHANVHLADIIDPLLILQGSEDKILPVESSGKLYRLVSSEDKTLKIFEGLYHELFNEPEKEMVFEYITNWIESRLK
jgi:acylglycerol lipase